MSNFKCSMCGASLQYTPDTQICVCAYCGSQQSIRDQQVVTERIVRSTAGLLDRAFLYLEDKNWSKADDYAQLVLDDSPMRVQPYLIKLLAWAHATSIEGLPDSSVDQPLHTNDNYGKILRFGNSELVRTMEEADRRVSLMLDEKYADKVNEIRNSLSNTITLDSFVLIARRIYSLPDIASVRSLSDYAKEIREQLSEKQLCNALLLMQEKKYKQAIRVLMNLEDYGDSKTLLAECKEKEALINNYQFGLNMMEERNWRPAAEAFSKCGDYENSQKYAAKCARFARQSRSPDGSFTIMHTLMSGLSSFFFSLMLLSPVTTRIVPLPGSIAICLQIAYAVICVLRNKYKTASHMFKSGLLLIAISIGIITVAPASVSSEITSIALVPLAILFLFI